MADTSLIFNIIARDKTAATLAKIKANAGSTGSVVAKMLGPAITPVLAVATGATLALGSALAAAGAGAGVFGAVVASSMTEVSEAATKYQDLTDKVELYGKQAEIMAANGEDNAKMLKKQAAAALELKARLALLPPETRNAVTAFMDMKSGWKGFVDQNKPATFGIMASGYRLVGAAIKQLQPFYDAGADAARRLIAAVAPYINGGGLASLGERAGPALASLTNIIVNVGRAVARTFGAFASDGQGMLVWLEAVTARWARFSNVSAGGGLQKFVEYFRTNGPKVVELLRNFVAAAVNIATAVAPLAPISLAIATSLAAIIAAMPPGVITALVAGYIAYSIAMKAVAIASAIMTAAKWAENSAFLASPITWIIIAVLALAAGIIWLATKTQFFQTVWGAVWGFMKMIGAWFAGPFAGFFVTSWNKIVASLNRAKGQFMTAVNFVKNLFWSWVTLQVRVATAIINAIMKVVNFVKTAPGKMKGALSNMFAPLWSGFRTIVNRIIGGWNRLSFGIPGFSFAGISVPGINVGTPNIPYLATGGDIKSDGLIYAHRGERMTKAAQVTRTGPGAGSGGGRGGATITINGSNAKVIRVLLELLREGIRDQGGDPVKVLTAK